MMSAISWWYVSLVHDAAGKCVLIFLCVVLAASYSVTGIA